jgi:hypothetical protein
LSHDDKFGSGRLSNIDNSTEIMMKRMLRSYVYNGFVWKLNCSTSGELNDDKSSVSIIQPSFFRAPIVLNEKKFEKYDFTLMAMFIWCSFSSRSYL